MTHGELVDRSAQWLKRMGCPIVFAEMVTLNSESPDAIGWRSAGRDSFLIECKASRSDFFADKHKAHRWEGVKALGRFRYYMTPPGLVQPEEVPDRWGLLYCYPKTVALIRGKHPKRWDLASYDAFGHESATMMELCMLYSALNRLRVDLGDRDFSARVRMPYAERKRLKPEAFIRNSGAHVGRGASTAASGSTADALRPDDKDHPTGQSGETKCQDA